MAIDKEFTDRLQILIPEITDPDDTPHVQITALLCDAIHLLHLLPNAPSTSIREQATRVAAHAYSLATRDIDE